MQQVHHLLRLIAEVYLALRASPNKNNKRQTTFYCVSAMNSFEGIIAGIINLDIYNLSSIQIVIYVDEVMREYVRQTT